MVTTWLLQIQKPANIHHKIEKLKIKKWLFINIHTNIQYATKDII